MSETYADHQTESAPGFLADDASQSWLWTLGIVKDGLVAATKAAVKARFAKLAPPDALLELARDRNLDAGFNETQASLRARVLGAWGQWLESGRPYGISRAFEIDGLVNVYITESSADPTLQWFEFDVKVSPPFPWPGTTIADVPQAWQDRIVKLIRKWKPTHTVCRRLTIDVYGETWAQRFARRPKWGTTPKEPWGLRRIVFEDIR